MAQIMVPIERSSHKGHAYKILKPYHLPIKRYVQSQNFQLVGQTSKSRGQKSNYQ